MSRRNVLKKLLEVSLDRGTNKKTFVGLLAQFIAQEPTADLFLGEILFEVSESTHKAIGVVRKSKEKLQIEYAIEYAFSSSESLLKFFGALQQLSIRTQEKYLLYIKGQLASIKRKNQMKIFLKELANYTSSLHDQILDSLGSSVNSSGSSLNSLNHLWYCLIFLWGALADTDYSSLSDNERADLFSKLGRASEKFSDARLMSYASSKFSHLNSITESSKAEKVLSNQTQFTTKPKSGKPLLVYPSGKRSLGSSMLSKFVWLNYHFRNWRMGANTTRAFIAYFGLKELDHAHLAKELTMCFLTGYAVALGLNEKTYVVFNWKNFILTQLPHDLTSLSPLGLIPKSDFCDAIITAVITFNRASVTSDADMNAKDKHDLGIHFFQACVYNGLLSPNQITKADIKDKEQMTIKFAQIADNLKDTHVLEADFKSKVENLNTEFISFDESKIIEFFKNLLSESFIFLKEKQQKIAKLLNDLVSKLVRDKNSDKLSWIILTLLSVPRAANYIFYQSDLGPWTFLKQIIRFIDEDNFSVDEDEGNFLDIYACFGIMLTGVISVATTFGVEFSSITIKNSYTIDYLSDFYFRLCDALTNTYTSDDDGERQVISNYENLFREWANALFDVNNDGLSDDLLKSVNVKQIYKFIFILFQQAIITKSAGSMNSTSFNNGIDYLSQNFLAPCSLAIMSWLTSRIGPQNQSSEFMIDVLLQIINVNMSTDQSTESSGPNFTFKMMLNAIGQKISHKLMTLTDKNLQEKVSKVSSIILRETDAEYCQSPNKACLLPKFLGCMSESLKSAITGYFNEGCPTSIDHVSQAWLIISHVYRIIPTKAIHSFLLQEAENLSTNRGTLASEASLFCIDFLISMLVTSSCPNAEDTLFFMKYFDGEQSHKGFQNTQSKKFKATIDDHVSSIFNVVLNSLTDPSPGGSYRAADHVMGDTEMDDLFDDISGNFFNESAIAPSTPQDSYDIHCTYTQSARFISPLRVLLQTIVSTNCNASSGTELARRKLDNELQKWNDAYGF